MVSHFDPKERKVGKMERFDIQCDAQTALLFGKDIDGSYFGMVFTNGLHAEECDCIQCNLDHPQHNMNDAGGWKQLAAWIKEVSGWDVYGYIVGMASVTHSDGRVANHESGISS